jgi:uncharacterized protein YxeA
MKWIILIIIGILVAVWLARGRLRKPASDPEARAVEKHDFYVNPNDDEPGGGAPPDNDRKS